MAKGLSCIVTEEKGDKEHNKAISMFGILINKAMYQMELQKKGQVFGMLIFIDKIESRDDNFFEYRDMIINKAEYDPELQKKKEWTGIGKTDYKRLVSNMLRFITTKKKVQQEGLRPHEEVQQKVSEEEKNTSASRTCSRMET